MKKTQPFPLFEVASEGPQIPLEKGLFEFARDCGRKGPLSLIFVLNCNRAVELGYVVVGKEKSCQS